MKTATLPKSGVLFIATIALIAVGHADITGPWPNTNTYTWNRAPIPTTSHNGTNFALSALPPSGQYWMPVPTTTPKNTYWLPYATLYNALYAERFTAAGLVFPPAANIALTNIHVKVYDGSPPTGKHGWAVIFKDSTGKILDFGIRPYIATAQIRDRQIDGTNWSLGTYVERIRTGNNYYTMDFAQNADGTVTWVLDGNENLTNTWTITNTTALAYSNLTEVYLSATTENTTGLGTTYKWLEFSVNPPVISPPPLYITNSSPDVTLAWPSAWTTNFLLLETSDLNTSWTTNTATPTDDNTTISVTTPLGTGSKFFRLRN